MATQGVGGDLGCLRRLIRATEPGTLTDRSRRSPLLLPPVTGRARRSVLAGAAVVVVLVIATAYERLEDSPRHAQPSSTSPGYTPVFPTTTAR